MNGLRAAGVNSLARMHIMIKQVKELVAWKGRASVGPGLCFGRSPLAHARR